MVMNFLWRCGTRARVGDIFGTSFGGRGNWVVIRLNQDHLGYTTCSGGVGRNYPFHSYESGQYYLITPATKQKRTSGFGEFIKRIEQRAS